MKNRDWIESDSSTENEKKMLVWDIRTYHPSEYEALVENQDDDSLENDSKYHTESN